MPGLTCLWLAAPWFYWWFTFILYSRPYISFLMVFDKLVYMFFWPTGYKTFFLRIFSAIVGIFIFISKEILMLSFNQLERICNL